MDKTIEILKDIKSDIITRSYMKNIEALDEAIEAIKTLNSIKGIISVAEDLIKDEYGAVIIEGYYSVFELIRKKVEADD